MSNQEFNPDYTENIVPFQSVEQQLRLPVLQSSVWMRSVCLLQKNAIINFNNTLSSQDKMAPPSLSKANDLLNGDFRFTANFNSGGPMNQDHFFTRTLVDAKVNRMLGKLEGLTIPQLRVHTMGTLLVGLARGVFDQTQAQEFRENHGSQFQADYTIKVPGIGAKTVSFLSKFYKEGILLR